MLKVPEIVKMLNQLVLTQMGKIHLTAPIPVVMDLVM